MCRKTKKKRIGIGTQKVSLKTHVGRAGQFITFQPTCKGLEKERKPTSEKAFEGLAGQFSRGQHPRQSGVVLSSSAIPELA